ncbi:hypothetical protein [Streptomyces echiniscabiei]|uniref:hypothetical protein n=1 Tax=Streptomyces echiniscabiei TaxID=3028708 RepID=UPI003FA3C6AC
MGAKEVEEHGLLLGPREPGQPAAQAVTAVTGRGSHHLAGASDQAPQQGRHAAARRRLGVDSPQVQIDRHEQRSVTAQCRIEEGQTLLLPERHDAAAPVGTGALGHLGSRGHSGGLLPRAPGE